MLEAFPLHLKGGLCLPCRVLAGYFASLCLEHRVASPALPPALVHSPAGGLLHGLSPGGCQRLQPAGTWRECQREAAHCCPLARSWASLWGSCGAPRGRVGSPWPLPLSWLPGSAAPECKFPELALAEPDQSDQNGALPWRLSGHVSWVLLGATRSAAVQWTLMGTPMGMWLSGGLWTGRLWHGNARHASPSYRCASHK